MKAEFVLQRPLSRLEAVEVFAEMLELLEDYGPTWYSEELRDRAQVALRYFRKSDEN